MRLALDTSTEAFSVAIEHNKQIIEHFEIAPRLHGDKLLPTLDKLLVDQQGIMSEVTQIVYGKGPGAFTGVRIAVSAAQGLALGVKASLIGVSSLQNLAFQALNQSTADLALVAMDARMGEVYFGCFKRTSVGEFEHWPDLIGLEKVITPSGLDKLSVSTEPGQTVVLIGNGWRIYQHELEQALDVSSDQIDQQLHDYFPSAKTALLLSKCSLLQSTQHSAEAAVPSYLRNQVAEKSQKPAVIQR